MAEINLRYSRRLRALVLKPGKRDVVSYRVANCLSNSDFPELLRLRWEDADAEVFYYGVEGLSELDDFIRRPMSLVRYRTMLESLYAVMDLCVREGLPQGNVCFDASYVYVDERGAMHFAFVPFERTDGIGSALDLLLYLSGREVRMVLPQDESARQAVADFARSRSVLPAADLGAFLAERFGLSSCAPAAPASGLVGGSGSLGYTGGTGPTGATGAAKKSMTFNPVAMMAGAPLRRDVAHGVAAEVAGTVESGPLANVAETSLLGGGEAVREDGVCARTECPRVRSWLPARSPSWRSCARPTGRLTCCWMRL
ncbi:MAG: hypothetical protein E7001_00130 [Coriobacteriaceae bacterium]|nr:hypothetical protein [Coriobacteriaceae bacterium]